MTQWKTVHMIGIKGAGMTALAQMLQQSGVVVRGSDVAEQFFTDAVLARLGIVVLPFAAENITPDLDAVLYSTAYKDTHVERVAAAALGLSQVSYPEALAQIFNGKTGLAVAGSHGKTTTSALLSYVLSQLGKDPSAIVGSVMQNFSTGALVGASDLMVLEADEYQNKLAHYLPKAAILTSVDYDHPDFFPTPESYEVVFRDFVGKIRAEGGLVIACGDDPGVRAVLSGTVDHGGTVLTYGFDAMCDYRITEYRGEEGVTYIQLTRHGEVCGAYAIPLVGKHNARNAAAVIALCLEQGYGASAQLEHVFDGFKGTKRRFEHKGVAGKHTIVIDDYAHHPAEVATTLAAAREHFPGQQIWCVFGPHTFSRTEALMGDFAQSFTAVDRVIVLDIYASAREVVGTITGQDLVNAINAVSANATYLATNDAVIEFLETQLDDVDVLITMGAGDVWHIGETLCH